MLKSAVLLVNLGSPNSFKVSDIRKYLREFLMDARVIDIPFWNRFLLVNFIIAPFRAPKIVPEYKKIATTQGFPLVVYTKRVAQILQKELKDEFDIFFAMRYQNPNMRDVISDISKKNYKQIILLPLFPQYTSATSGSVFEETMKHIKKWNLFPKLVFIENFYDRAGFIQSFSSRAEEQNYTSYSHFLFSYHGLPERQLKKPNSNCIAPNYSCCNKITPSNRLCYRAQCVDTTRLIANKLHLSRDQYSLSFQSRLGKTPWIKPYTEDVTIELAKKGVKKMMVFSPSFVSDCLETIVEIGDQYKKLFYEYGGEKLELVESLNTSSQWIEALKDIIQNKATPYLFSSE